MLGPYVETEADDFAAEAFGAAHGPVARFEHVYPVMSSHTVVSKLRWTHALAINLAADYELAPSALSAADVELDSGLALLAYTGYGAADNATLLGGGGLWSDDNPIPLAACNESDFALWHAAPVLPNGHALYCAWNTDNGGPQKVQSVQGTFSSLRKRYGNARVFSSTL